ncbi:type IV pilus modification PilV family protein [Paraglaciecola aestuariivivens]
MHKVLGFTLIEVLVASMLIMLGVTGYVSLQSEYVLADDKLNLRSRAWQLAEQKLDDLTLFTQLSKDSGELAYASITNNSGGTIPAGEKLVRLSSKQHTQAYVLKWTVIDLYYVDSNFDGVADSWIQVGDPLFPSSPPLFADLKSVAITVDWLDTQGNSKSISLMGRLAPMAISQSAQVTHLSASTFAQP